MNIKELSGKVNKLKEKYGAIETNFYMGALKDYSISDFYENEGAILIGVEEENKHKFYYYYGDEKKFVEILENVSQKGVIEVVSKEKTCPIDEILTASGIEKYATYVRYTTWWENNPYEVPEKGRRKLLQEMYDPTIGQYATMDDLEDLDRLVRETFDPICDDVFTRKEWEKIIENKNCLLYREAGEVTALYIWRIEGKKLYSNMSINMGSANILYDMERRIFTQCWDEGIRISYAWFNVKNDTAINRSNKSKKVKTHRSEYMFNYVYMKK